MASLTLRAFAKINLSLRISAVREDGFHDVQTLLQAIDLFDRVKCETRRGPFEIRCDMPGVPTDHRNLVWKAAQLLWDASGRAGEPKGAIVTLQKQIPMMAGLGGGSSDAAAALIGLRRLWKLRVSDEQVHALASRLGSDVPFFLLGGTALGLGRGDELYPLANLPRYWVVLAIPPFGIATPDAYRWFDEVAGKRFGPVSSAFRKRGDTPFAQRALRERPGSARRGAAPGYCRIEAAAGRSRSAPGGDVGERFHRVRRIPVGVGCPARGSGSDLDRRQGPDSAVFRQVYPP